MGEKHGSMGTAAVWALATGSSMDTALPGRSVGSEYLHLRARASAITATWAQRAESVYSTPKTSSLTAYLGKVGDIPAAGFSTV